MAYQFKKARHEIDTGRPPCYNIEGAAAPTLFPRGSFMYDTVLLFIFGLLLLIKGGDRFVDGATALARRAHVPELLIGATVVLIGTTLPEVMVSATAAVGGSRFLGSMPRSSRCNLFSKGEDI